jgi:hypothetical protein
VAKARIARIIQQRLILPFRLPQPLASPATCASRSCPTHSAFPWAGRPTQCPYAARTRCLPAPCGRLPVDGHPSTETAAPATAARPAARARQKPEDLSSSQLSAACSFAQQVLLCALSGGQSALLSKAPRSGRAWAAFKQAAFLWMLVASIHRSRRSNTRPCSQLWLVSEVHAAHTTHTATGRHGVI